MVCGKIHLHMGEGAAAHELAIALVDHRRHFHDLAIRRHRDDLATEQAFAALD
ncbi:hypothetical protein D3C87_1821630 [compost metagenome]